MKDHMDEGRIIQIRLEQARLAIHEARAKRHDELLVQAKAYMDAKKSKRKPKITNVVKVNFKKS